MKLSVKISLVLFIVLMLASNCSDKNDKKCTIISDMATDFEELPYNEASEARALFESHNINIQDLHFAKITKDDLATHVKCNQFVNGLKVFTEPLIYHFSIQSGNYMLTGDRINTIKKAEEIIDSLTVLNVFLDKVNSDTELQHEVGGCFIIEFGYYDLNIGSGLAEHDFVDVWKITTVDKDDPYAFISNKTGEVLYYDNLIRN